MTLKFKACFLRHYFFLWSFLFCRSNADSLRIPIGGHLVYDTMSKTADLCLSPHMCPPCVLDALCQQENKPNVGTTAEPYSTEVSSSSTSPSPTATTSSSTELTSTASTSTTDRDTSAPTEEPASSTPTPTSSTSSTTDQTQPSASPSTSATEATEATETTEATESTYTANTNPTVTTAGGGMEQEGDVLQVGLKEHNRYRKIHNSPPLSLSSQLNSDAQSTAEKIAPQGKLIHTDDSELNGQGENLGKFCATDETPEEVMSKVTGRWYKEVCKYDFSNPGWTSSVGHFTQLVWASTQELGLGWATNDEGGFTCYYIAARYYPEGNIDNRFEDNVMKGSFDSSYCNSKRHEFKPLRKLRDLIWPKWYRLTLGQFY